MKNWGFVFFKTIFDQLHVLHQLPGKTILTSSDFISMLISALCSKGFHERDLCKHNTGGLERIIFVAVCYGA